MPRFLLCSFLYLSITISACQSQTNTDSQVGGACEGCEALYEYGDKVLSPVDTLPLFASSEPKLKLWGKVYQKDGETPAAGVILYIYHTDRTGIYATRGGEKGWGKRHGFIRGWVKTDDRGDYAFYTFRPSAYPDGTEPEHIHLTVKEPNTNAYYLDNFVFEDDPILDQKKRSVLSNRGGSGLALPVLKNGILEVNRDIILGLNIPDYD
ncbi:intradiol ring-cleavage dioxygenase [Algoriphagus sp. H41]|uniref:Intradiol ring-cleavage dioxygenase n=1 Tax=Algoriphagus oliviformis TaxID=2811231 RepID=A0ABS3BYB8_9BACT|nr:intradiol ring-cleavage dioxygenase [Algoriphagus oliviformis]MBN7809854.1 intradiol ring-cleavage dioxygenase [Algoriphagus oliviformis]